MEAIATPVAGALILRPAVHRDDRGYFKETYSRERYRAAGVAEDFVQDNVSLSRRGTLRGLHAGPRMAKLVEVLAGRAYDVAVDIRPESATYLAWHGEHLRADEHKQFYIPAGCLHGFLALEDDTMVSYKQSAFYDAASEFGVAWDDPEIAIAWPLAGLEPLLSSKDARNPTWSALSRGS